MHNVACFLHGEHSVPCSRLAGGNLGQHCFSHTKKTVSNEAKAELTAEFLRATQTFVLFRF